MKAWKKRQEEFLANKLKKQEKKRQRRPWRTSARRLPVSTKCVEVNKGTTEEPDVRCRMVALDFRVKGEGHGDDLFATMPPSEAKKLLFKMAVATWKGRSEGKEPDKIMLIDVKRNYLNGVVGTDVWACIGVARGRLRGREVRGAPQWLYGMRPTAKAWEDDNAEKLERMGFPGENRSNGVPPPGVEGACCRAR